MHTFDANRQQALVPFAQRLDGTGIKGQRTTGLQVTGQPLLACRQHATLRRQQGTQALTCLETVQHALQAPADDDRVRPGAGRQTRSAQLGLHTATAQRTTRTTRDGVQARIIGTGFVDQLGIGVGARVGIEHAIAVGEDHQQISLDQIRHQRRQGVVITETDLVGDHRVVFVDNRYNPQLNQRAQGAAGVQVTLAVRQVVMGQKDLRSVPAVFSEARLPRLHQAHLADGSGCLQLVHGTRSLGPAQAAHTGGYRPGRHQHQLDTRFMQRHHLLDPDTHGRAIQAFAICRQQGTADFHDPALGTRHLAPHLLPTYADLWILKNSACYAL